MTDTARHFQTANMDGVWNIKTSTTLKSMELKFKVKLPPCKLDCDARVLFAAAVQLYVNRFSPVLLLQLNEEFDETTPDGRDVKAKVTFEDGKGGSKTFNAGDTFFVPLGTPNSWKSESYLRKIFVIFQPKE